VPALERMDEDTAYFKDGTSRKVDAVILCTGYKHHFPFLPDDLRLKTANRLATADLYKGVAWVHNPKLFFLISKSFNTPPRVIQFLALIALFSITYPYIKRYASRLVEFLSMLGRNSLYVFCVGSC
jgi:hypothetical protein